MASRRKKSCRRGKQEIYDFCASNVGSNFTMQMSLNFNTPRPAQIAFLASKREVKNFQLPLSPAAKFRSLGPFFLAFSTSPFFFLVGPSRPREKKRRKGLKERWSSQALLIVTVINTCIHKRNPNSGPPLEFHFYRGERHGENFYYALGSDYSIQEISLGTAAIKENVEPSPTPTPTPPPPSINNVCSSPFSTPLNFTSIVVFIFTEKTMEIFINASGYPILETPPFAVKSWEKCFSVKCI